MGDDDGGGYEEEEGYEEGAWEEEEEEGYGDGYADETINYAKNSNKVPQSDGARPCLDMPDRWPGDPIPANWPDDVDAER